MPIYEFECKNCETRFEKLCSISAGTKDVSCPKCNGNNVSRLMSMFASTNSSSSGGGHSCGSCGGGNCSGCHH